MNKPDRIAQAVEREFPNFYPNSKQDIMKLLRRESSYQRARVRRIVDSLQRWEHKAGSGYLTSEPHGQYIELADLLAALKGGAVMSELT